MATDCFLDGCENKANTDRDGRIPLMETNGLFSYVPPRATGQGKAVILTKPLYFCSVSHLADYLLKTGAISKGERYTKLNRASDDSARVRRELAELEHKRKQEQEKGKGQTTFKESHRLELTKSIDDFEIDF